MNECVHVCIYIYICIYTYAWVYMYMYIFHELTSRTHTDIYIYIYISIYIHIPYICKIRHLSIYVKVQRQAKATTPFSTYKRPLCLSRAVGPTWPTSHLSVQMSLVRTLHDKSGSDTHTASNPPILGEWPGTASGKRSRPSPIICHHTVLDIFLVRTSAHC